MYRLDMNYKKKLSKYNKIGISSNNLIEAKYIQQNNLQTNDTFACTQTHSHQFHRKKKVIYLQYQPENISYKYRTNKCNKKK